jgi:hypothetical protein
VLLKIKGQANTLEREIDQLVYEIYGLSNDERNIVAAY